MRFGVIITGGPVHQRRAAALRRGRRDLVVESDWETFDPAVMRRRIEAGPPRLVDS